MVLRCRTPSGRSVGRPPEFPALRGLPLDQEVPDYSTISRFRAQLAQLKLGEGLFGELNRQLAGRGLLVKQGTMLDATLIEASVKPVRGARSTPGQRSPHDADADWTKRGHQPSSVTRPISRWSRDRS